MTLNRLITPEGTKDYLFEEAVTRKNIENKLRDSFEFRGYHEVITPALEFLDVVTISENGMTPEQMYKLVDSKGRLMALRPDSTIPIARLCATRLKNEKLPLRLYYNQPVYSVNPSLRGRSDEIMQTGIEIIGAESRKSDVEVLVTAAKAVENLKIDNFRIELGHIGIFNTLVNSLNVSKGEGETVRQLIESKNYPALNDLLDSMENRETAEAIKLLPRLFGGREVLNKARNQIENEEAAGILDYLEQLYDALSELGLGDKITLDLGIVNRADYYTGIVFKGYVEGFGEEVLSGGRYDGLLKEFGKEAGAIGFAVNVDAAANALMKTAEIKVSRAEVLVFSEREYEVKALEYVAKLAELKITAEYSLCETLTEALDDAKERGIPRLDVISDEIKTIKL